MNVNVSHAKLVLSLYKKLTCNCAIRRQQLNFATVLNQIINTTYNLTVNVLSCMYVFIKVIIYKY